MDELNQNVPAENAEQEHAMKCENNEANQKAKTPALFKAGIALMCATSALSLGAIGACGFLGYKLYKNSKNNKDSEPENSMGSVVTNKQDTITISADGYWVINGVKTSTKAKAENGTNGLSVVSASVVKDKWGITSQILFIMSDGTSISTSPQTQVLSEHFYEASSMSDFVELTQIYNVKHVRLTNNINLSSNLEVSGDMVIDLNRNTLTYSASRPITVAENSSLTFKKGSLELPNETGVSVSGANAELVFEKVNISASAVVAETLEDNASITLEDCTFQAYQANPIFASSPSSSIGSLFVVKGANASLEIKESTFDTNRAIISASENAQAIKVEIKETKLNTSAPVMDIDTNEVVPTLDVDQDTIASSTITELNTTPITSGTFNVDPTELGATLEGVEMFDVNGSTVLAENLSALVSIVESGSTINLSRDTEIDTALLINKKLTFNLGNYRISAPQDTIGDGIFHVVTGGDLTIESGEEGLVYATGKSDYCMALWADGGKITVNGGCFSNANAGSDDQYDLIYASNAGEIVINNGYFMCHTPKWTLNLKDNTNSSIVVNGGWFIGYNPGESHTENPVADFVAEGTFLASDGYNYAVISAEEFYDYVNLDEINYIKLYSNVEIPASIVVDRDLTFDLGNYTISIPNDTVGDGVFYVPAGGNLTINSDENGKVDAVCASPWHMAVWVDGGNATINGGTFTNKGATNPQNPTDTQFDLIYVKNAGSLVINGGTFIAETPKWTLNLKDNSGSSLVVNGGTFVGYNPTESHTENPLANFVAEGYFVYKVGNNYSVDSLENLVSVINNNAGANIMLPTAYVVDTTLTINLNGCTISTPNDTIGDGVFHVITGGNLTINGEGTINGVGAGDYHMAIWVEGGKATINGGTYTNIGATEYGEPAEQFDLMYVKGGELVINGGTFTSQTPKWILNLNDKIDGSITVNGGTFVGYNPAESHTENPVANFVTEEHFVYKVGNNYSVDSLENLVSVINNNAGANIMLPTAYVVDTTLTINLNGCTISTPNDTLGDGVFHVITGGNLTINGEGTINGVGAGDYHMAIWVEGGKATINGGTYTNIGATEYGEPAEQFDLMYVKGGELVINGGTFTSQTPKWILNLNDKIDGTISVNGGTFVGYNPAESHTENPVANFVTEGHKVVANGDNYTVVAE